MTTQENEEEVSTPENEGVVINVDNTPPAEEEETDAPDNSVVVAPTIIVEASAPAEEPQETREEIEQEIRDDNWRDSRIAELEEQVAALTIAQETEPEPEPEIEELPAPEEITAVEEEAIHVEPEPEVEPEAPERDKPKSAGPHPLFRSWGSFFGKDN